MHQVTDLPAGFDTKDPKFVAIMKKFELDISDGSVVTEGPRFVPNLSDVVACDDEDYQGAGLVIARIDDAESGMKNLLWAMELGATA